MGIGERFWTSYTTLNFNELRLITKCRTCACFTKNIWFVWCMNHAFVGLWITAQTWFKWGNIAFRPFIWVGRNRKMTHMNCTHIWCVHCIVITVNVRTFACTIIITKSFKFVNVFKTCTICTFYASRCCNWCWLSYRWSCWRCRSGGWRRRRDVWRHRWSNQDDKILRI